MEPRIWSRPGRTRLVAFGLMVIVVALSMAASSVGADPVRRVLWPLTTRPTTTTTRPAPPIKPAPPGSSCSTGLLAKAGGGYWQCSLDEEFNGTTLNRSLWFAQDTATSGFHSGPECLVDSPNNISVANGVLTLTVRKEAAPFICADRYGPYPTQYTSASVSTYGLFAQAYGRFEVRAKFPSTSIPGLQESLWLWPDNPTRYGAWPMSGEIDIAEEYSQHSDRVIPFVHYNSGADMNVTNNYCMISDVGQFHSYAVEWTPQSITIIYDGHTCLVDTWNPMSPQVKPQPFDQPFIVALTQLLGVGTNAFDPVRTPLPASTQVDYVRVWK